MTRGLSLVATGHATSLFLAISFTCCVAFDLLFPSRAMYRAWMELLPGFQWISWGAFFLGLVESYGYGWYFALIWGRSITCSRRAEEEACDEKHDPSGPELRHRDRSGL